MEGGASGGPTGPGGSGGPPPDQDEDDDAGDGMPPSGRGGPPGAGIVTDAECAGTLCRASTGQRVSFEDAGGGGVRSRLWDFGDGQNGSGKVVREGTADSGLFYFFDRNN